MRCPPDTDCPGNAFMRHELEQPTLIEDLIVRGATSSALIIYIVVAVRASPSASRERAG